MRIKTCGAGPDFEEGFATGFAAAFRTGFAAGFAAACRTEVRVDDFVARRRTVLPAARRVDRLVDLLAVI
jgi:hypothetical protein